MSPTRRGFVLGSLVAGGTALFRRVSATLTPSSATRSAKASTMVSSRSGAVTQTGLTHGPFLGDLTTSGVKVWARFSEAGSYRLFGRGSDSAAGFESTAEATLDNNLCVVWSVSGLEAATRYAYGISSQGQSIFEADDAFFVTPRGEDVPTVTRFAVGSCAREDDGSAAVWRRMSASDPHVVVLLGDTPYIDSTDLDFQRVRHGEFAAVPDLADLLRRKPLYATWDDHDFGANDSTGLLEGRETSRRVFIEHRANPSYGDGQEGVYTKFRRGGVEVFLLDTRYFAGTEPSSVAPSGTTLLGPTQWDWLRRELRASTAPFKVLASGMIWNWSVRPGKQDHWETYPHEKEALFRFIGEENITGVVLMGGDIHRTRVLRHETTATAGYPLTELVTSPIHGSVIDEANAPHPALLHDSGEPHSFLLLTADTTVSPATLVAEFQNSAGRELYSVTLDTAMLQRT